MNPGKIPVLAYNISVMMYRMGSALILLGVITLTVFLVTFFGGQFNAKVLLVGCGLCTLGLILHRRHAPEKVESGRFQTMRHLLGRSQEDEEKPQ